MTVGTIAVGAKLGSDLRPKAAGSDPDLAAQSSTTGRLLTLTSETTGDFGEVDVTLAEHNGLIHADLSVGANVASAVALASNANISSPGVKLHGAGFIVTHEEAALLLPPLSGEGGSGGNPVQQIIRDYRNGRDLAGEPRKVKIIDAYGFTSEELRKQFPAIYQRIYDRVKPERDANPDRELREKWWLFRRTNHLMRSFTTNLPRYIATVETAKHRTFQFLDASILPDNMLIAIGSKDAFHLGVLSTQSHAPWAWANGGSIGMYVGNVRFNKSRCFETFPFPAEDTGLTPELHNKIAALAEQIDAHRKRQQAAHPGLTLTGMYNVLEALKAGRELTPKEKTIHTQGLVGVLKELHDELDAAVLQAYGLEPGLTNDALLSHLVTLNAQRAEEEKTGKVRWLRPEFQNPTFKANSNSLFNQELLAPVSIGLQADLIPENDPKPVKNGKKDLQTWPNTLPLQVSATAQLLASAGTALSLSEIEASFKGKGPWKKGLPRILETLQALGRARLESEGWRAL